MRVYLVRAIAGIFGHPVSDEEARLNWDVVVGVVAAFAALIGSVLLWEPTLSRSVIAKVVVCGLLVLISVFLAFERGAVVAAALCFTAMRLLIGALEVRSLASAGVAVALFVA